MLGELPRSPYMQGIITAFITHMHWAESSKMINNLHLIHCIGFLYLTIYSTSQSAKNILKALHSSVRNSNNKAVKFCHTFSMRILLSAALWCYVDTCLWWNQMSHSRPQNLVPYKRNCYTLWAMLWPTYVQGKTPSANPRKILTAQVLLSLSLYSSIGVSVSEPNDTFVTSHLPHSCHFLWFQ